jgi:hypothetical protein
MTFAGKWMEMEIMMLSKVSKVQKDKSHMFSLICGRQIQKMNVYTNTSNTHTHTHTHIYIYTYMLAIVGLFEETNRKENDSE